MQQSQNVRNIRHAVGRNIAGPPWTTFNQDRLRMNVSIYQSSTRAGSGWSGWDVPRHRAWAHLYRWQPSRSTKYIKIHPNTSKYSIFTVTKCHKQFLRHEPNIRSGVKGFRMSRADRDGTPHPRKLPKPPAHSLSLPGMWHAQNFKLYDWALIMIAHHMRHHSSERVSLMCCFPKKYRPSTFLSCKCWSSSCGATVNFGLFGQELLIITDENLRSASSPRSWF